MSGGHEQPFDRAIVSLESRENAPNEGAEYIRFEKLLGEEVRRLCPHWLWNHREDIVQEGVITLLKVKRKREANWRPNRSYLRDVAYTRIVDAMRKHRPQEVAMAPADFDPPSAGPDPHREHLRREIIEAVRECLSQLVKPRRLAVTLFLLGDGVPRIAERMNWTRRKASNLVYRGLANMRDCLTRKGLKP